MTAKIKEVVEKDYRKIMDAGMDELRQHVPALHRIGSQDAEHTVYNALFDWLDTIFIHFRVNDDWVSYSAYAAMDGMQDDLYNIVSDTFEEKYWTPFRTALEDKVLNEFFYHQNGTHRHQLNELLRLYGDQMYGDQMAHQDRISFKNKRDYDLLVMEILLGAKQYSGILPAYTDLHDAMELLKPTQALNDQPEMALFLQTANAAIQNAQNASD